MEVLYFVKLSDRATLPTRAYNSIGFDLSSAFSYVIQPGKRILVSTDLAARLPEGTYARIALRSGLSFRQSIDVGAGVIDPGYRGNISVVLINNGENAFNIQPGDRIAQLICERACIPEVLELKEFSKSDETQRGDKGFGSTGLQNQSSSTSIRN